MRVPLPKLLVRLAWKARVGYSWFKSLTHLAFDVVVSVVTFVCLI